MKKDVLRPLVLSGLTLADGICWIQLYSRLMGREGQMGNVALLLAAVLLLVLSLVLWRGLFVQLDELEDLTDHWEKLTAEEREARLSDLSGIVGGLGTGFARFMGHTEADRERLRRETREETERTVKRQIARDICQSALPRRLPDYPSREYFQVTGRVRDGWQLACVFYDCFYIDPGLLCVAVGQVPDGEVSEALYMNVAQTTIRSRLRLGRSLAQTMGDVNGQMYDLGGARSVAALVGTLDTASGRFSFVNAGSCPPLLMRNGKDYEWLSTPVFAALGGNQNVGYSTQELRLRQGDRIFLHTAGLGAEQSESGVPFREQALRSALIRGRNAAPEVNLQTVIDHADTFCPPEQHLGFAALLLEYRKGDRELSHCVVPASPEYAQQVMDFLKGRFEENGIRRRDYATVAVMAEELFSLCCQRAESGTELTVECGVAPDGGGVTIRVSGRFRGRNPLDAEREDSVSGQSAQFIEDNAEFTTFKAGEEADIVSIACFLTGQA